MLRIGRGRQWVMALGIVAGLVVATPAWAEPTLNRPGAIAISPSGGNQWVADVGNSRLVEYGPKGVYMRQVGTEGSGPGQFEWRAEIVGIAVSPAGNVYVSDYGNNRIEEFTSQGVYEAQFGNTGSSTERVTFPGAVTIDASGNVWVLDAFGWPGETRLLEFSSSGRFLHRYVTTGNGTGQLERAFGLTYSNGSLYVTDFFHSRVLKFGLSGEYEGQFAVGWYYAAFPWAISANPLTGNLYLSVNWLEHPRFEKDWGTGTVEEYSSEGTLITKLPNPRGQGEIHGVAVTYYGNVMTVDDENEGRLEEITVEK
jgi:tripartite motif-containing protein 71